MILHKVTVDSRLEVNAAKAALVGWFPTIGFRLESPAFLSELQFGRGSLGGNAVAVDPRKIRATVAVTLSPTGSGCRVEMEWKVVTGGQLVTRPSIDYWRAEVAAAERVAKGEPVDAQALEDQKRRTIRADILRLSVFSVALLVPFGIGLFVPNAKTPMWIAAAVLGTAVYWSFRAPRRL